MTVPLSQSEWDALAALAGEARHVGPKPRTCQHAVGTCREVDHIHPSPGSQQDRVEYMLEQGFTRAEIRETMQKLVESRAIEKVLHTSVQRMIDALP